MSWRLALRVLPPVLAFLPACGSSDGTAADAANDVAVDVAPIDVPLSPSAQDTSSASTEAGDRSVGDALSFADASEADAPSFTDPCNPPAPNGYHALHVRYLWAGQRTFTLFPKPEQMPASISFKVDPLCNTLTCTREQDRPWFNCAVPDAYFVPAAGWLLSDATQNPEWSTGGTRPMPTIANEYWLRWSHGLPSTPQTEAPPNFEFLDFYPDNAFGDWAAMGQWNDSMCAQRAPATPVRLGFGQGGWFPYSSHQYAHGGSLARVYANAAKAQDVLDAFAFERYKLWKQRWIKRGADACGSGTARVANDTPQGTTSRDQGTGIAMAAALGDKQLFDELWNFVRRYRSQAKYCGLMGATWQGTGDCQPVDSFATSGGNHDSAFGGDMDIGIGLVYAALQWPEYADAATDWLLRMECEVNSKNDGWNYPSNGDAWDKVCPSTGACTYASGTISRVSNGDYSPAYFRVFGDFLAAQLVNNPTTTSKPHRDYWYRAAETAYELVERCYDQDSVHPGLMASGGDVLHPCSELNAHQWERAAWRLAVDSAWFGNDASLPENKLGSSPHFLGKSRMQAKIDNIQGFYADFHKANPPEPNANRFSTICDRLSPAGTISNCDPTFGHTGSTVNVALAPFTSLFDNGGATTTDIRRQALEESLTAAVLSDQAVDEALAVYSLLFVTGNFRNPMAMPGK